MVHAQPLVMPWQMTLPTMATMRVVTADDAPLQCEGIARLLVCLSFEAVGLAGDVIELTVWGVIMFQSSSRSIYAYCPLTPPRFWMPRTDRDRVSPDRNPRLSAHVEVDRAIDRLPSRAGIDYLLKSRVTEVGDSPEILERIGGGGSVDRPGIAWSS